MLSIEKFGLAFWKGRTWNPVSGVFGAFPFIWGTLYSSLLALLLSTPIALGIAVFLSDLSPRPLRQPPVFLTELLAAIPSIVYALCATRWEAIRMALFYGRQGIMGAVMLGLGRALGETMAVTMVIGNAPRASLSLFAPQHTMAAVIANEFSEAADDLYLHALVEIGLVLFVITVAINTLSRLLIWRVGAERA